MVAPITQVYTINQATATPVLSSWAEKTPVARLSPVLVVQYFPTNTRFIEETINWVSISKEIFSAARLTTEEEYDAVNETFHRTIKSTTTRKNRK